MQALPAAEVRERFLRFFEDRGHQRMSSDSLVPANDPTLLFTGAGMNQFKDMFLGRGTLPHKRVTTAQKCLRVPDLEEVGRTPRHHTFFEMLGNFSFGDYFKEDCIRWEWEFFTKELGIPADQLVVTVYQDDDEAAEIWQQKVGLAEERIFRFGEKENFWPAEAPSKGPNGPCGPCSEIYYDIRPKEALPGSQGLEELPGDRFVEIGNCVFTQFDRQEDGSLLPLPQRNIDVGLGLERIVAVLAGVKTNFDTDLFAPYLKFLGQRGNKTYGEDKQADVRMRRISDHLRAITFCIADGAVPSNEGRGYVVRKILRRAIRDGYELGIQDAFLHEMVDLVGEVMGDQYPEVRNHAGQARSLIRSEEDSFAGVYKHGAQRLQQFLAKGGDLAASSGEFAFQLHDTYGFPVDITRQMMLEQGVQLDEAGFTAAMEEQRQRARASAVTADAVFADSASTSLVAAGIPTTEFCGYEKLQCQAKVLALLGKDNKAQNEAATGESLLLVVDQTPFYPQGGGQVGDRGTVESATALADILETTAMAGFTLHQVQVKQGSLQVGDACQMQVDTQARQATQRNHTATHLLHAALKQVLGAHVNQAGSVVEPGRLRFDFTSGEKLTADQLQQVEDIVNEQIMQAHPVSTQVCSMDQARERGFIALFGEKYGDQVRTLQVGEFSKELCGGTHVANSGNIGSFRILSESAISAGTRRLEGVTGLAALQASQRDRQVLGDLAQSMKSPVEDVSGKIQQLLADNKKLRKDLEKATAADLGSVLADLRSASKESSLGTSVVLQAKGLSMKDLQDLLGRAEKALAPFAGVVLVPGNEDVLVGAAVSKSLVAKVRAGDLVSSLAKIMGGGGGGRPEMAQGRGKDPKAMPQALSKAQELLQEAGF